MKHEKVYRDASGRWPWFCLLPPAARRQTPPAETKAQTAAEKPAATEKAEESAPAAEPVTLTWGSWVFAEDSVRPIYQEMADLYNETNEYNTTISTEYFYSYADYLSTLLIDVAGGNGPDVAHIKAEWLPQLLALGVVKPLDGYISADVLADYSQSAIDSVTVDGSMMALPGSPTPTRSGEYRPVRAGWR